MLKAQVVSIFALCSCLVSQGTATKAQSQPTESDVIPAAKRVVAPDFTISDVQGKPFRLAALKGRVVLVDFWAIACGGCKLELPWYVKFDHEYSAKGLSLVGLDMYGEAPGDVRAFAASQQMRYPVAIGTDAIGDSYHLKEMPLTVLVDRKGRIAVSHAGVVDPQMFEQDLKTLLSE